MLLLRLFFLVVLVSYSVQASPALPVTQVSSTQAFQTMDQAAVFILKHVSSPFAAHEVGGVIIERQGQFFYSDPVTTGSSDSLGFKVRILAGDQIVAYYHTHPKMPLVGRMPDPSALFSLSDVRVGQTLKGVVYLAAETTGEIRRIDPQSREARRALAGLRPSWGSLIARLE